MKNKPRILALYLPQYHPLPENDIWWGKGFTEWTNVGRAKPLFKGHYQPKVPSELGYYDLRLPCIREEQAELARKAGIEGFCYWHYWLGNGKRLMETIFDEVLNSGKPDFPFCLAWANHSWYAKNWNTKDTGKKDKLLIEQRYTGIQDYRNHYEYVLKAFKDHRYIKYNNMPVFMIYDAVNLPTEIISLWNKWAKEDGFINGIYFIGNLASLKEYGNEIKDKGFNAITKSRILDIKYISNKNRIKSYLNQLKNYILGKPAYCFSYEKAAQYFTAEEDEQENFIPSIIPNYDHSPRSGQFGVILDSSTPENFRLHLKKVFSVLKKKKNNLCILKSWNEWGEGNYMEPDIKFKDAYIKVLKEEIDNY